MSLLLCIDTAQQKAGVYLGEDGLLLDSSENEQQQDHASWIHIAIDHLLKRQNKRMSDLSAVAVIEGPGSYTGLRVGMSTAKGLCYALAIPLITESSLRAMAASFVENISANISANFTANNILIGPMIDARRMEVFTALYDNQLTEKLSPRAMILDDESYKEFLNENHLFYFGNGSDKWKAICKHPNANFVQASMSGRAMYSLCYRKFINNEFAILTYSEPVYLKEFYTHHKK